MPLAGDPLSAPTVQLVAPTGLVLGACDAADGAPLAMLAATGSAPSTGRFASWRLVEEGASDAEEEEEEEDLSEGPYRFFGKSKRR